MIDATPLSHSQLSKWCEWRRGRDGRKRTHLEDNAAEHDMTAARGTFALVYGSGSSSSANSLDDECDNVLCVQRHIDVEDGVGERAEAYARRIRTRSYLH